MVKCLVSVDVSQKYSLIKFLDTSNEDGDEQVIIRDLINEYDSEKPGVYIVDISVHAERSGNPMDGYDWDVDLIFNNQKECEVK